MYVRLRYINTYCILNIINMPVYEIVETDANN